jgi:tryptophan halogenase
VRHEEGAAGSGALATRLADYSLAAAAASLGRFAHPAEDPRSVGATLNYAYHLDSASYAVYLRKHAEKWGVERMAGDVLGVNLRGEDGFIESVLLDGGQKVAGDLFIDASGLRGALIERAMQSPYESWSRWLPCDRVVRVSSAAVSDADIVPCTTAVAGSAGWQWHIPLRRRVSHGYVYCSSFCGDELAEKTLRDRLGRAPIGESDIVSFVCGKRKQLWTRNCVALGAAACFLDPLGATQIHLIHSGIAKLLALFPYRDRMNVESGEYNRLMGSETERIRDFLILHYAAPRRSDTPFWAHCATMTVPASLERKIGLFANRGRVVLYDDELFGESSWAGLLTALGIWPGGYDPLAAATDLASIQDKLRRMQATLQRAAHAMPKHRTYLDRYCPLNSGGI